MPTGPGLRSWTCLTSGCWRTPRGPNGGLRQQVRESIWRSWSAASSDFSTAGNASKRRSSNSNSGSSSAYNPSLMPFINRPTPVLRPRSVAGLSKKDSANCWRTLQNKSAGIPPATSGSVEVSVASPGKSIRGSESPKRIEADKKSKGGPASPAKSSDKQTGISYQNSSFYLL